jgi:hypothetical protein
MGQNTGMAQRENLDVSFLRVLRSSKLSDIT